MTSLAEKRKEEERVKTADTNILMPVTVPSITPRHTRHTDSEYAMPHREKHDFNSCTPNKEKRTTKGGAGARIIIDSGTIGKPHV